MSSRREEMPSLVKTLRRCHSTVRTLMNSPGADFCVREAVNCEPRDFALLGRQRDVRLDRALAYRRTGQEQLVPGTLGETHPCPSRRTCRTPFVTRRERQPDDSHGAAIRRTASVRAPAPDAGACARSMRSTRNTSARRCACPRGALGRRVSTPCAQDESEIVRREEAMKRILGCFHVVTSYGSLDEFGEARAARQRGAHMRRRSPPRRLRRDSRGCSQESRCPNSRNGARYRRPREPRHARAPPSPDPISRPRYAASIRAPYGDMRIPVACLAAFCSATSDSASSKLPQQLFTTT